MVISFLLFVFLWIGFSCLFPVSEYYKTSIPKFFMAVLFNTLQFQKSLATHDFTSSQSEGLTQALGEAFTEFTEGNLATKSDIADVKVKIEEVKTEFNEKLNDVKLEFNKTVSEAKIDMIKWSIGIALGILLSNFGMALAIIKVFSS